MGLDVADVDVEVQLGSGLPSFTIVGLPDKAVAESRERVRAALGAMGLTLPPRRITVNLAPADLGKEGSHFDLPIALGLLIVMGVLPVDTVEQHLVLGERALDGGIRRWRGCCRPRSPPPSAGWRSSAPPPAARRRRGSRTRWRSWPRPASWR
jgi:magnesium chelatase family protein